MDLTSTAICVVRAVVDSSLFRFVIDSADQEKFEQASKELDAVGERAQLL
jgi:hypothetical protein